MTVTRPDTWVCPQVRVYLQAASSQCNTLLLCYHHHQQSAITLLAACAHV